MQQRLVQARPFNVVRGQGVYGGIFRFDPFPRMRVIERTVLDPTGAGIETANIVSMRVRIRHLEWERGCTADLDMMVHWRD